MTLTSKRPPVVAVVAWSVTWVVVTLLSALFVRLSPLGLTASIPFYLFNLLFLITFAYVFEERFSQRLFVFFMFWGFSSFLSAICKWGALGTGLDSGNPWVWVALYFVVFSIAVVLYRALWSRSIRTSLRIFARGKPVYVAFPLVAFVVFVALYGPLTRAPSAQGFFVMLLVETLVLLMYYILFAQFRLLYERLQAENRLSGIERHQQLQKRYFEEVEKDVQAQARLLHDARHHFLAVASLAQQEDAPAVDRYVAQLLKSFGLSARRYCEHSLANAVIGSYVDIAEKEGIAVTTDLDLPSDLGINDHDLCTLFGNSVENAVEACRRIPETSPAYGVRHIDLRSSFEEGRLVVRIENSYEGHLGRRPDLSSSKGEAGGIGLESVAQVVRSYSGSLDYNGEGSIFVFSAVLFSPLAGNRRGVPC